ncbi:hypothetical protein B0H11DRAFT_2279269 [Mycena galericulata]|nr:hypothetical protein B0H11DRAFT_2279269 [Mycena galericulata]
MRNFSPARFPTSDASFTVFNRFPMDIGLEILEKCSPFDLAQLARTSTFLRSFLRVNSHLWKTAQVNLAQGDCPPLPAPPVVEASGNYSQFAYALWLFDGGPCTWCSKWTDSQPCHFLFRFRSCSPRCRGILFSDVCMSTDKAKKYDDFFWGKWLSRKGQELPNGQVTYTYSTQATKDALRERHQAIGVDGGNSWRDPKGFPVRTSQQLDAECDLRRLSRPAISKNAEELDAWYEAYVAQRAVVQKSNFNFLKGLCIEENKKVQGVLRCPTMARLFFAFNRDLQPITHTVWTQVRDLVLAELKFMGEGVFPEGVATRPNDKVRCTQCNQLLRAMSMADHVLSKHKGRNADTSACDGPEAKARESHCRDCPSSRRLFTERGLRDHQLNKHGKRKSL